MPYRCLVLALALLVAPSASAAAQAPRVPVSEVVRTLERAVSRVQHVLGRTRVNRDDARSRCVDDQLSQLHATLRLALERQARAARFEARGDAPMASRERALLARLLERGHEIERGATLCIDPDALTPTGTRVTVIIEPDVPTDAIIEPSRERPLY